MKRTLAILAIVALAGVVGCEKKSKPDQVTVYKTAVDGAPQTVSAQPDPGILKDQAEIARGPGAVVTPGVVAPGAPTTSAPAGGVEGLKQAMTAAVADAKVGKMDTLMAMMPAEMQPVMKSAMDLPAKQKKLEDLMKAKGLTMPEGMVIGLGKEGAPPMGGLDPADLDPASGKFAAAGADIVFTDAKGKASTFTKTAQGWQGKMDNDDKAVLPIMTALIAGVNKVYDDLTAGIDTGAITQENFELKAKELAKQNIEPAMSKLVGLMTKGAPPAPAAPAADAPAATAADPAK